MTRLHLLGQTPADLPTLSALLQDATLRPQDLAFDPRRRRLALLINRYRAEAATPSRIRAALRLETVTGLQHQNWPAVPDAVLALLSLHHDDGRLVLTFAAGTTLRARVEAIDVILEDLADPWPTEHQPHHE